MKNLLIIYPHWPPSNLAGVHRPRLIANFTKEFGWKSNVLTVSSEYYEEAPDLDLNRTVSFDVEVFYSKALKVGKPRIIGDIGIRAMPFLYKAALKIIPEQKIDFIWIPIPSFYTALLGRLLHEKTAVPYGIDYIDPWIRDISNRPGLRSKLSLLAAKWLEPIAVKNASLISGVSEAYYKPVLTRNFKRKSIAHVGMPYGFDPADHAVEIRDLKLPWDDIEGCKPLVYAGAFLPNAHLFVTALFKVISVMVAHGEWDMNKHLYFLGTGYYTGTTIADYADQYEIKNIVHETRERFPYLHVLNFLSSAFAVMSIGSTERHYTASKIFQSLLSRRPVFSIFHKESSAVTILKECNATDYLIEYDPDISNEALEIQLSDKLDLLINNEQHWQPNLYNLDKYSGRASAYELISCLNKII
ncbi:hypothetical protein ACFSRY_17380 [Pontibacter locisalis]|uniref:Glycosyltransferase subfamily 4-like N-terminal domain-containing protein n=1 Tax=Pontibacter locisalis TaxID=1719035 RepID=A0ABW5ISJ4_9BACT